MILQALHDFAIREKLVGDVDFQMKPIAYHIAIGADGELLGIPCVKRDPPVEEGKKPKKNPRKIAPERLMPREGSRTRGDRALFLYDKAEYVFGIDPDRKRPAKKLAIRSALFRERVQQAFEATDDEALGAVLKFLQTIETDKSEVLRSLDGDVASNDLFAFFYRTDPEPVTMRPKVVAYWKELRRAGAGEDQPCLITGQQARPVDKHTTLKFIPGAITSGVPLISFNASAFESYGLSSNQNALISRDAAETFADGLQRLLHPSPPDPKNPGTSKRPQNWRLSADTTVVYWTSGKSDLVDIFGQTIDGDLDEVERLLASPHKGRRVDLEDPMQFYALTLSGSQGRAIIRSWFQSTVVDVEDSLRQHFLDLALVRNTPKPKKSDLPPHLGLRTLLQSLSLPGKSDGTPPALASQLLTAAMDQRILYPQSILQRAIQRTRAEIGRSEWLDFVRRDARAALIKAVLNRRRRAAGDNASTIPEIQFAMDPENTQPGYLLGRLMAVAERLQIHALERKVNATVVDKYFSAASATPRLVFVRLLKGTRYHARKAKESPSTRGLAIALEKEIDEILSHFDAAGVGIHRHLSLEEQGNFILGYHQRRHLFFTKKDAASKVENEETDH